MDCQQVQRVASGHASDDLSPVIHAHLSSCPACTAVVQATPAAPPVQEEVPDSASRV